MKRTLVILILVFSGACRQTLTDWEWQQSPPLPVIEALITDSLKQHYVKITYSTSLGNDSIYNYTIEPNAKVYLTHLGKNIIDTFLFENGEYRSTLKAYTNGEYRLDVKIGSNNYSATNTLTNDWDLAVDTIYSKFKETADRFNNYGQFYFGSKRYIFTGDSVYSVYFTAGLPTNNKSFYRAELFRNKSKYKNPKVIYILGTEFLNGVVENQEIPASFILGDTVGVLLYKISEKTFRFYESMRQLNDYEGGIYSPPPGQTYSNFDKNVLGFFECSSQKYYEHKIK